MSPWKLRRERRQQKRNVFLLLTVAGAVRPVDIVIRYRGTDRLLGTLSDNRDSLPSEAVESRRSIWNTDIRELWKTYRHGTAAGHSPS